MKPDLPGAVFGFLRWLTLAVALAAVILFALVVASVPSFLEVFIEFDAELPVFAQFLFDIPQGIYWAVAACAMFALIGSQFLNLSAASRVAIHAGVATALTMLTMLVFVAAFMPLIGLISKLSNR
jgi:type II secretory pathway component PulF